jgi:myo-inositol 2-dehydrogenase/D-chiro-inositol 1-dehydrogenase
MVALSREETGAVVVPDLPDRLHPGVVLMRQALGRDELGPLRVLRHESPAGPEGTDLARQAFPRVVDVVRAVLGEVEALTATGDPPGEHPSEELVVQLRVPSSRRAEVRLWAGGPGPSRLVAQGAAGSLTLEYHPALASPARLVRSNAEGTETVTALDAWDPHAALLDVLIVAVAGREVHPNLLDGTRATELAEAAVRSLRRGRTVELHYEQISETSSFKSVMTSLGCVVLLAILVVLPAALAGPALGFRWTIYVAYLIPPALVLFVLLQSLRLVIRRPEAARQWPKRVEKTLAEKGAVSDV